MHEHSIRSQSRRHSHLILICLINKLSLDLKCKPKLSKMYPKFPKKGLKVDKMIWKDLIENRSQNRGRETNYLSFLSFYYHQKLMPEWIWLITITPWL